ncbi:MAG TPA: DUF4382 domain-containing protein [Candidatus Nanoarchaeia archaeon]|nr:DUF4382 domain-containing protein [Candidatus Nanoarchaeia archaeon]
MLTHKNYFRYIFVILVFSLFVIGGCAQDIEDNNVIDDSETDDNNQVVDQPIEKGFGRIIFAIKDVAADMNTITSVDVTIDQIEVHNSEKGWTTISSTPMTFDLLQLKQEDVAMLMANVEIEEGSYQQIRILMSNILIRDEAGLKNAKLPSGELKIVGDLVVNSNSISTVVLDFVADESIHLTSSGKYIFAPVINFEIREDANTDIDEKGIVKIENGNVNTNTKIGMDASGNVGVGLTIPKNKILSLGSDAKIKVEL